MTNYTKINKPTGTAYTNTNSIGKQQYDESSITYDSAGTFYDGTNMSQYTNALKPVGTAYTNIAKPL